ncbi:SDR family NAD(P)-dependent oxidoreductase [Parasediminibacterium paludis]|uniref:SDR family NAD(P)-dependent oxidoreductase n=1 Tax=Parasediminibacterium paludis TaxID=908966 RepID=A0ABV8PTG5_9BACT
MEPFVIITGASSGLGKELAIQLAAKQHNIILVARNEKSLLEVKMLIEEQYKVNVIVLPIDLSIAENALKLYDQVISLNVAISSLINNAGVGLYGEFKETSLEEELKMIELNISSLVALTKVFIQYFLKNGGGKIMNIASLLSFLPFPYFSVYSATKSFVLSFTETVAAELEGTNVAVLALCPGTIDTPFHSDKMWNTNAYQTNKPMPVEKVAIAGVKLLEKGKGKTIVGFNNWFISNLPRLTPDFIMIKIKKYLASQKK